MASRRSAWILVAAVLAFGAIIYVWNPQHSPSWRPLDRVLGIVSYRIPGASMAPTLHTGDVVVIFTGAYSQEAPRLGDIIAFRHPAERKVYVKRVIAGGGSRISMHEGVVYINDEPLEEPYVDPENRLAPRSLELAETAVPSDQFFVLSDNRDGGMDSRQFGLVPRADIVGKMVTKL
jgi:signal peptidase I